MQETRLYLKGLSSAERGILISQSISTVGDFMALPAFLVVMQNYDPGSVSIFLFFYFIPRIFQPALGYLSDRYNARTLVLITEVLRGLIFLGLFVLPIGDFYFLWLGLVIANSFLGSIFDPARLKIMTAVATNFSHYNAIFNFFFSAMGVVSVFISLLIEAKLYSEYVFLFNAVTFFVSVYFLSWVKKSDAATHSPLLLLSAGELLQGFKYFKLPRLGLLLLGIVYIDFFTGVLYEDFPEKSLELNLDNIGTYLFTLVLCLGNATGALAIPYCQRIKWLDSGLVIVASVASYAFLFLSNIYLALFSCFMFFVVQMIAIGVLEVEIEHKVPNEHRGRAFALGDCLPIMTLSLGGMVSQLFGTDLLLVILASGCVLFTALATNRSPNRARVDTRFQDKN